MASQTHDPFLVALAATVQWLPPLLFGLYAGALADRLDRRLIVVVGRRRAGRWSCCCCVASIVTGQVSVAVVLVALFLVGTAEVFADNTSSTLLPMLVARDDLAIGNARLVDRLHHGQPARRSADRCGALRRRHGLAVRHPGGPGRALGALLVSRIVLPAHRRDPAVVGRIRHDIAEGFRWVRHHAAVRTLVLTIFTFNITFGAAWSVLVLYATQRLGMGAVGFGLLTTVSAVGGLVGTLGVRLDHPAGQPRPTHADRPGRSRRSPTSRSR